MVLGFAVNIASFLVIQRTSSVVLELLGSVDSSSRDCLRFVLGKLERLGRGRDGGHSIKIGPVIALR